LVAAADGCISTHRYPLATRNLLRPSACPRSAFLDAHGVNFHRWKFVPGYFPPVTIQSWNIHRWIFLFCFVSNRLWMGPWPVSFPPVTIRRLTFHRWKLISIDFPLAGILPISFPLLDFPLPVHSLPSRPQSFDLPIQIRVQLHDFRTDQPQDSDRHYGDPGENPGFGFQFCQWTEFPPGDFPPALFC
jgi:hypothetical protein